MSEFTNIYQDHLISVVRGDDVVGHIVPTALGYTPYLFVEDEGVFQELTSVVSKKRAELVLQDLWVKRYGECAA